MEKLPLINSAVPYLTFIINNGVPLVDVTTVYSSTAELRDKYAGLIQKTYEKGNILCIANNKEIWDTAEYQQPSSSTDTHYFDTLENLGKTFDVIVESEFEKLEFEKARLLEKRLTSILATLEEGIRIYLQSSMLGSFAMFFRNELYVERLVRFLNVVFAIIGWDMFSAIQNHVSAGSHKYKTAVHKARYAGGALYVLTSFFSMSRLIICYERVVKVLEGISSFRTFEPFLRLFCIGKQHRLDKDDAKRLDDVKKMVMIIIRDLEIQENDNGR